MPSSVADLLVGFVYRVSVVHQHRHRARGVDAFEGPTDVLVAAGVYQVDMVALVGNAEFRQAQVVLVPAGSGTSSSVGTMPELASYPGGPARLLAFALDGKAELPLLDSVASVIPKPPLGRPSAERMAKGEDIWLENGCELCHGFRAIGAPNVSVPDLRLSNAQTYADFATILSGARWDKGMPVFSHLTGEDSAALRDYVLAQAWLAYARQQTDSLLEHPVP